MERSILEWSIRALLLVIGTGLVVTTLRLRGASVLHRAWTGTMVAMLLVPAWTKWGPSVAAPVLPAAQEPGTRIAIPLRTELHREDPLPGVAGPFRSSPAPARPSWQQLLAGFYLAGIAVMLVRLVRGTLQVHSILRGVREAEGFVTSPRCAAPVTIGWLRPVVLVPEDWRTWPAAKLGAVLVHEREHVRRRDPLVQWLALLNRCVFWFHPLAWWLERKLAVLAEEACDTAVLAGGHEPHQYARYLIEMARSINATGARLRWAGAVEFSTGKLARRIRRIMDAPQEGSVSRAKSLAAGSSCAVMLASFLACTPERRATSGQERNERAQARQFNDAEVSKAALTLTPDGVTDLDADVKAHPNHADQLQEILDYYQSKQDSKALKALTFWFIEHHPGMRQNWAAHPAWDRVWDQDALERGGQLWTAQLKKSWDGPFVYMNAAEFLSGNDNPQAEQILLEGQRKFPNAALHWEVFLARHYAWALAGHAGQLPEREVADLRNYESDAPARGAYAQKVRQTLLASKDTELLARTAEQLQINRPNLEFARTLVERVLEIDPDSRFGHIQRDSLQRFAVQLRAKTDPGSLRDSDRMILLNSQLYQRYRPHADSRELEAEAREFLKLASRNTADPNYGTAIFQANIALGRWALNRGDQAGAVQHLLAASEAPPSEFMRYHKIDLSLAQDLVDAGQRESVATFLDRCAKFNSESKQLVEWSIQIREGLNPRLTPVRRAG